MSKLAKHQQGVALIMALLVIAIGVSIATGLILLSRINIHQAELIFSAEQTQLDNTYALAWAQQVYLQQIYVSPAAPQPVITNSAKALTLPIAMPIYQTSSQTIDASLTSPQGLFNLNNLSNPAYIPIFAKLIQLADNNIREPQSLQLANSLAYFIGKTHDAKQENVYQQQTPPYLPAHNLLASASELRLVTGFDADLYQKLAPNIIALPMITSLDPSTASEMVLMSYGLTQNGADAIINYVQTNGDFKNLSDFYLTAQFQPVIATGTTLFDTKDQFFLVTARIKLGDINWTIYNILQTDRTNGKLHLLQMSRNTL